MKYFDKSDICLICLEVNVQILQITDVIIKELYTKMIEKDKQIDNDIYLCLNCKHILQKIALFKDTCFQSRYFLEEYLENGKIDASALLEYKPLFKYSNLTKSETTNTSTDDVSFENYFQADIKNGNVSDGTDPLINFSQLKYEDDAGSPFNYPEDLEDNIKTENSSLELIPKKPKEKKCQLKKKYKSKKTEEDTDDGFKITDKNLSHLSREEQFRELEEKKQTEEFIRATYKCEDCAITFKSNFYLENHMKKHDILRGELQCWLCKMRFSNKGSRKSHVWVHSIRMVCHICPYKTNAKVRLLRHLKWHAGYSYTCRICGDTFAVCEKCNFVCSSPVYLLKHQKVHLKNEQNYCVECDTYFKSEYSLNYHLKSTSAHKDQSLLRHKCEKCSKKFETDEQLSAHVQSFHEKVAKFSCELCGARYVTRHGLNFHRRKVHQGFILPLKYECTTCAKKFTSSSLLKNHIRTHTGERPFECKQCDWKFSHSSALRMHVKLKHLKIKNSVPTDLPQT